MLFCSSLARCGFSLFACGFQHVTYGAVADAAVQTFGDQPLKLRQFAHALLISPDEITHIVAGVAVASGLGLRLYPLFHGVGKRYIHCRHDGNLHCAILAKIGKECQLGWGEVRWWGCGVLPHLPMLRMGPFLSRRERGFLWLFWAGFLEWFLRVGCDGQSGGC